MVYLDSISFPGEDEEWSFRMSVKRTCYNTLYPFYVLSGAGLERIDFAPVTILYGGNGSGKTTALNVIAEKLGVAAQRALQPLAFFRGLRAYVPCAAGGSRSPSSRIVTSDDVFDYMLDIRSLNEGIDRKKETLFEEHVEARHSIFRLRSLEDYEDTQKAQQRAPQRRSRPLSASR